MDEEEILEEDLQKKTEQLRSLGSTRYVKKGEQYSDLKSTGVTFILFGILGLIFVVLNITKVITLVDSILSFVLMTALFIGSLFVGITNYLKSQKVKIEVAQEEMVDKEVSKWLTANITDHFLKSMNDTTISEEANYLNQLDAISKKAETAFPDLNESYLEQLIEEYYNSNWQ